MPIYFPRGFNSGEPVRVVDGVTVVRGAVARQPAELIVVASARTLLGAAESAAARAALRAFGAAVARRVRALPRGSAEVHVVSAEPSRRRWLGFVEVPSGTLSESAVAGIAERIATLADSLGAREIALACFGGAAVDARALVEALRARKASAQRWILVVRDRAQFDAATAGRAASSVSP